MRISTTVEKLSAVLEEACKAKRYKYRMRPVSYKNQKDIEVEARRIALDLTEIFDVSRAADMLYMKRDAFSHEREWRATLLALEEDRASQTKGITVKINPHDLIDRILLDPRAPDELVNAFKYYFKYKIKFKGDVGRSMLYRIPEPLIVDQDVFSIDDL